MMTKLSILLIALFMTSFAWAATPAQTTSKAANIRLAEELKSRLPEGAEIQVSLQGFQTEIPNAAELISLMPDPPLGMVTFQFYTPGKPPQFGHAVVRALVKVAVATKPLASGDAIGAESVRYEKREISAFARSGYFTASTSLKGMRAHGYVSPGTVLTGGNCRSELAVTPGQTLELLHETAGLMVTAQVKAKEGGRVGDWIYVENPSSKKQIKVRIAGPGEVVIR